MNTDQSYLESMTDQHTHLSPALLEKFLCLQQRDIEIKAQDSVNKRQLDENNFSFAKLSLDVTSKDRQADREHKKFIFKSILIFSGLIIFTFFVFLSMMLYIGKDELAFKIIETILYITVGGIGGYSLKSTLSKEKD